VPNAEAILERKGRDVITVEKDTTVLDVARIMNDNRIGAVIVVSGERVLGVFTERDILTRVVAAQANPAKTLVADVMTTPMACCTRATTLDECKAVMTEKHMRHLPVVEDEKLYGMISSGDILGHEVASQEKTIRYLSDYLYGRS
jgi:CBS domain-containing protein